MLYAVFTVEQVSSFNHSVFVRTVQAFSQADIRFVALTDGLFCLIATIIIEAAAGFNAAIALFYHLIQSGTAHRRIEIREEIFRHFIEHIDTVKIDNRKLAYSR